MDVRMPDGTVIQNVPEGTTKAQLVSKLKSNGVAVPADWLAADEQKSTAKLAGGMLNDVPRQIGLTARYALEGAGQAVQPITEPLRQLIVNPLARALGAPTATKTSGDIASGVADLIGLPKPQGANERTVAEATRMGFGSMAGAGALSKLAGPASNLLQFGGAGSAPVAQSTSNQVVRMMADNPLQQVASAAGAGAAQNASKEAGGGLGQQTIAAVVGGVAGGMAGNQAANLADAGSRLVKGLTARSMSQADVDIRLDGLLKTVGVDYRQIPEGIKQQLRADAASALQTGREVDPQALARLAAFRNSGLTPTRGMISQDPVQITREQNLARIAANTSDGELQGLPRLLNQNNTKLIGNLNSAGANRGDLFRAGESVVGDISAKDAGLAAGVTDLYTQARAMPGGNTPLNRSAFVNAIYDRLAQENKLAYLPDNIANMLNTISYGQITRNGQTFQVPFNANALDNLMTDIATAQRSTTDGNVKAALKLARQAIDSVKVEPVKTQFGGNQLVTEAGAQFLRNQDAQASSFMEALGQARSAARSRFGWQESGRPIEAALGGAQPDNFVQRFVIGGSLKDAQDVVQNASGPAVQEVRNAILAHLKERALNGAADEVGKFSPSAYNKALNALGDRKLSLFFSPEELSALRDSGRAAALMHSQPVGSAVNNSNSGALMLGKGYDWLRTIASKVPMGQQVIVDPLRNIEVSFRQQQAQNFLPGLLAREAQSRPPMINGLMLPGLTMGGLLAAPSVD